MQSPGPVLVTRPAREAARWVEALRERGLDAHAVPLIEIASAPDGAALAAARSGLDACTAAMFVSANAVEGFTAGGLAWPDGVRAWATGPGTRDALLAAGVPLGQVDAPANEAAQFDSETLWALVRSQIQAAAGARVLIVRGGDAAGEAAGRNWLADQLVAAGAQVEVVVAYVRRPPAWDEAQHALARAGARGQGWWLFSSSEAVGNLQEMLPGQDLAAARALCTHPRIAQAAQDAGFGVVAQTRPVLEAVAGFLQSGA